MAISKELFDELMATSDEPLIGPDGLSKELTKALVERMLAGEMNHHLGYEKHAVVGHGNGQLEERQEPEDAERGSWRDNDRSATGPERDV